MAAGVDAAITELVSKLTAAKKAHDDAQGKGRFAQMDLQGTIDDVFTAFQHAEHIRKELATRNISIYPFVAKARRDHYRLLLRFVLQAQKRTLLPPKPSTPTPEESRTGRRGEVTQQPSTKTRGTVATMMSRLSRGVGSLTRRGKEVEKALSDNPEQLSEEAGDLRSRLTSAIEALKENTALCTGILNSYLRDHGQRSHRLYYIPTPTVGVSEDVLATGHAVWNDESIVPTVIGVEKV